MRGSTLPEWDTEVAAGGAVAGMYAANDAQGGVWVPPAGVTNGVLAGALAPSVQVDDATIATLDQNSVDTIRSGSSVGTSGVIVWGTRTLGPNDQPDGYVASARTDLYIRSSIETALQWVVFEPSDPQLWASVTDQVDTFLTSLWEQGALAGATAAEAFTVTCDASVNPPETILEGQLSVEVAVRITGSPQLLELTFTMRTAGVD